jgi:hypothetical protein
MTKLRDYTLILLFVFATGLLKAQKYDQFYSGQLCKDNYGVHINAHGGGAIIQVYYIIF